MISPSFGIIAFFFLSSCFISRIPFSFSQISSTFLGHHLDPVCFIHELTDRKMASSAFCPLYASLSPSDFVFVIPLLRSRWSCPNLDGLRSTTHGTARCLWGGKVQIWIIGVSTRGFPQFTLSILTRLLAYSSSELSCPSICVSCPPIHRSMPSTGPSKSAPIEHPPPGHI